MISFYANNAYTCIV